MQKQHPAGVESETGFHSDPGWPHYRALMLVEDDEGKT